MGFLSMYDVKLTLTSEIWKGIHWISIFGLSLCKDFLPELQFKFDIQLHFFLLQFYRNSNKMFASVLLQGVGSQIDPILHRNYN